MKLEADHAQSFQKTGSSNKLMVGGALNRRESLNSDGSVLNKQDSSNRTMMIDAAHQSTANAQMASTQRSLDLPDPATSIQNNLIGSSKKDSVHPPMQREPDPLNVPPHQPQAKENSTVDFLRNLAPKMVSHVNRNFESYNPFNLPNKEFEHSEVNVFFAPKVQQNLNHLKDQFQQLEARQPPNQAGDSAGDSGSTKKLVPNYSQKLYPIGNPKPSVEKQPKAPQ